MTALWYRCDVQSLCSTQIQRWIYTGLQELSATYWYRGLLGRQAGSHLPMLKSPLQDNLRRFAPQLLCDCPHNCIVQHQVLHMPLLEPLRAQRAVSLHQHIKGETEDHDLHCLSNCPLGTYESDRAPGALEDPRLRVYEGDISSYCQHSLSLEFPAATGQKSVQRTLWRLAADGSCHDHTDSQGGSLPNLELAEHSVMHK